MQIKRPGELIEDFEILAELGQGAASVVYLVQDPKSKQVWALKHLERNDPKDQRFLDQALAEYELAQHLDHPAIRKIVRCIRKKQRFQVRELLLLMELVDGTPMDELPPPDLASAVEVFRQIADAMAYMHTRGFVHADMKPHNVILTDDRSVKLIDLGQSCKIGTVKERIQGTPDYIAPEQVERRPITEKTDVYNLGATMYWVLARKNIPTAIGKGDGLVATRDAALVERAQAIGELVPGLHPKLESLIMSSIEPDASRRPRMADVSETLSMVRGVLHAQKQRGAPADAAARAKNSASGQSSAIASGQAASARPKTPSTSDLASDAR